MPRKKVTKGVLPSDYTPLDQGAITIWSRDSEKLDFIVELVDNKGRTNYIEFDLVPSRKVFSDRMCFAYMDLIFSKLASKRWASKTAEKMNLIWKRLTKLLEPEIKGPIDFFDMSTLKLIASRQFLNDRDKEFFCSLFQPGRTLFDASLNEMDLLVAGLKDSVSDEQSKTQSFVKSTFNNEYLRQVVRKCSQAYVSEKLSVDAYLYLLLLVSLRCRNESLQNIRLQDCYWKGDQYFVGMWQAKRNTEDLSDNPNKRIPRTLRPEIGRLIEKRKYQLIERFKTKHSKEQWGKIPLFPMLMFTSDTPHHAARSWNKDLFDVTGSAGIRFRPLIKQIRQVCGIASKDDFFGCQDLRSLVASDLASRGFDTKSIQLALHHATPKTAAIYVDLHFNGLIESISDSFLDEVKDIANIGAILAFQSREDFGRFDPKEFSRISRNLIETPTNNGVVESGSCSNRCHGAPHACYECPFGRFIPFIEANHRVIAMDWENKALEAERNGKHNSELARTFRRKAKFVFEVALACEAKLEEIRLAKFAV